MFDHSPNRRELILAGVAGLAAADWRGPALHPGAVWTSKGSRVRLEVNDTLGTLERPAYAAVAPDESTLYVTHPPSHVVTEIDLAAFRPAARIRVDSFPHPIACSPDGGRVDVGCHSSVTVLDRATRQTELVPTGIANDLVVSRDSRTVYVAANDTGLQIIDASSFRVTLLDPTPAPVALALTPDGSQLFVNYQSGGPGGRDGHDALARFDTRTGRRLGTMGGFANVGGLRALATDGRQVWASGLDACSATRYDHIGCPMVPAGLLNVLDALTGRLVRSIPLAGPAHGAHVHGVRLHPDGQTAWVTASGIRIFDRRTLSMIAAAPMLAAPHFLLAKGGRQLYCVLDAAAKVVRLDVSAAPRG